MGNQNTKNNSKIKESRVLFFKLAKNHDLLLVQDLKAIWEKTLDTFIMERLLNILLPYHGPIKFEAFENVYESVCSSDVEIKANTIFTFLTFKKDEDMNKKKDFIPRETILDFVESVSKSLFTILSQHPKGNVKSWDISIAPDTSRYVSYLIGTTCGDKNNFDINDIRQLLTKFDGIYSFVVRSAFGVTMEEIAAYIPKPVKNNADMNRKVEEFSILNLVDILFLNSSLPLDYQNEWRLLFSTKIHGESFAKFSMQIIQKGPTLIVIKDKKGNVFGGFAPSDWSFSPKFVGDSSSFLFTLNPQMNLYCASNFNNNFQYLNQGQQTMPNGLGMGGKLEYFGLWLDHEFGKGIWNASCTTYRDFKGIANEKEFEIDKLEVWAVGEPAPTAEELGERTARSVLDEHKDARAILDMAGKANYSDGLREEEEK